MKDSVMTASEHGSSPALRAQEKWTVKVELCAISTEVNSYAHKVTNGWRDITVAYHDHQNYDFIHTEERPGSIVKKTGLGPRKPDLTPHPEAIAVARALNELDQPRGLSAGDEPCSEGVTSPPPHHHESPKE